jgi:hypothetical protein
VKKRSMLIIVMALGCSVDVVPVASVPVGSVGLRPYVSLPASNETATGVEWNTIPTMFRGRNGLRVKYDCPPNGDTGSVWGTDIYTDDSSVCYSAVHFGRISLTAGGSVVIEIRSGRPSYANSTRNGVTSLSYADFSGSFIVL